MVGSTCAVGYIVVASRLARFGVSATQLFDAQYLVAGLLPGFVIWTSIIVITSASKYDPIVNLERTDTSPNSGKQTVSKWWTGYNFLLAVLGTSIMIGFLVFAVSAFFFGANNMIPLLIGPIQFLLPLAIPIIITLILLAELALWVLIVQIRTRKRDFSKLDEGRGKIGHLVNRFLITSATFRDVLSLSLIFGLFVFTPFSTTLVYDEIPQSYGGGKSSQVRLYVDPERVPSELLDPTNVDGGPSRTVSLNLIFRTSTEYIVVPVNAGDKAWLLGASSVYALVEETRP